MTTPHRDLALVDPWRRSLERSLHRRSITPAIRRSLARRRRASVALSTLMVAGPTGSLLAAAGLGLGGPRVDVAQASPANRAIDDGATPAGMAFKLGSRGEAVAEIQRQLGIGADGFFGPVTHAAVTDFQSRNGLDVDGVVGPATWTALFGLEQAAAAAGARDGNVAVIVRERGATASAASTNDASTAGADGGPAGSDAGDRTSGFGGDQPATGNRTGQSDGIGEGGSGGTGRETLAVGGDLPDSAGDTQPADDAPATKPVSSPPAAGNGACGPLRLASPVKGMVTSGFGPRWGRNHDGLDIAAPTGTPIRAAECGIVSFAGVQSGYGNMVCVKHSSRFETCYAHMTKYAVSQGERVDRGQVIGYVGCTGNCTGPHLHFETRVDGAARDPRPYLGGGSVPGAPTVKAATASKARVATAAAIATDVKQARIAAPTVTASSGATGSSGGATAWSSVESQQATSPATTAAPVATTGGPASTTGTSAPAGTGTPAPTGTVEAPSAPGTDAPAAPVPTGSAPAPAPTAPVPASAPTTTAPTPEPTYSAPTPAPVPAPSTPTPAPEPTYSAPTPAPVPAPSTPTPAPEPTYEEPPAATTPSAPAPPAPAEPTAPASAPAAETTTPAPPAPATPAPEPSAPAPDPATQPVTEAPVPTP